jgi:moderate conductance mechanosensitive channel
MKITHISTWPISLASLVRSLLTVLFCALVIAPASAQAPAPPAEKLQQLMKLMDDPDIRKWVEGGGKVDSSIKPAVPRPDNMEVWEGRARLKIRSAAAGLPILTSEYAAASSRVIAEARSRGMMPAIVYLSLILLAAAAGEWVLRRFALLAREEATLVTTMTRELVAAGTFAAIAVALFFVADWPPLLRAVLRSYLIAALLFRLVLAVSRILVVSGGLSPVAYRRTLVFCGLLLAGLATMLLTVPLDIDPNAAQALTFIISITLTAVLVEALWRQAVPGSSFRTRIFQTVLLVALWVVWALGFHLLAWVGLFALFLPKLLKSMEHLAHSFALAGPISRSTV